MKMQDMACIRKGGPPPPSSAEDKVKRHQPRHAIEGDTLSPQMQHAIAARAVDRQGRKAAFGGEADMVALRMAEIAHRILALAGAKDKDKEISIAGEGRTPFSPYRSGGVQPWPGILAKSSRV